MSVSPLLGRQLGRYVLIESLGRGGMAEVFRARDSALARTVAIKVIQSGLAADPQFVERFLREARLVAALDHPHILPLWDLGEADGLPFLVMPCLEGGSLARRMNGAPLPLAEVVVCIRQLAEALDFAHQAGILHRDVKPANVLIGRGVASTASAAADDGTDAAAGGASATGHETRFVLADFGIAKASDSATRLTVTGSVVGTPVYMAPELAQGKSSSPASDRYALAVMAFELLTGGPPFVGENALSLMHQHVSGEVPAVSSRVHGLPRATDYLFRAALAKEPERRPPSSRALADALALLLPLEGRQALGVAGLTQTTQPWYQLPAGAVPAVAASADRRAARDWRHAPDTPTRAEGTVGTRVRATDPTLLPSAGADDPGSLELAPTARQPPLPAGQVAAQAGSATAGGGRRRLVLVVALLVATASGAFLAQRFLFGQPPTSETATAASPAAEPSAPAVAEPVALRAANSGPGVDPSGGGEAVRPEPAPSMLAPPESAPAMASPLAEALRRDPPVGAGPARRDAIELRSYQRRPSREDYEAALSVARSGAGAGLPEALVLPLADLANGGLAYLDGDLATARRRADELSQRELAITLAGALPAALWRAEGRGEAPDWAVALLFGDPSGTAAGDLARDLAAHPDAPSLLMAQAVLARLDGRAAEAARLGAAVWASGPEGALAGGVAAFLGEQAGLDGDRARGLEWYQRAVSSAAPPAARGTWALLAARMARDLRQPADVRRLTLLACELGVRVACQPPTAPAGGRRVLRPQRPR